MAKVTQLIPAPSHSKQARQLMLAIITLAEKSGLPKGISGPATQSACVLIKRMHDMTIDVERINVGGKNMGDDTW